MKNVITNKYSIHLCVSYNYVLWLVVLVPNQETANYGRVFILTVTAEINHACYSSAEVHH